jgi:hypothetical protein
MVTKAVLGSQPIPKGLIRVKGSKSQESKRKLPFSIKPFGVKRLKCKLISYIKYLKL